MRILTVRQPWAWAIIHGGKDVENRVQNIAGDYRGPVAIHAALSGATFDASHADLWPLDRRHVTGGIIGVADLVDVHFQRAQHAPLKEAPWITESTDRPCCGAWAVRSAYHLVLANPHPLTKPIPYKGALGLRKLDPALAERIEREAVAQFEDAGYGNVQHPANPYRRES